jgi:lysophospholipase L1-like esterase
MHLSGSRTHYRWLNTSVLVMIVTFFSIACSPTIQQSSSTTSSKPQGTVKLPGQQIWKQGVSSFLFGTNDTQEWADNNVETNPDMQRALKDAHFTLMRTFFFDKSLADGHPTNDTEIEQRLKTIENSGMTCLGVLYNIFDVNFDKHVVTYAGPRCQMYEFGNESDYTGISIEAYLKQWNTIIPLLRRINPHAKFIGPVTYNDQGNHDFMRTFLEGVKESGVLPDAISFHWYPCYQDTRESCLAKASGYGEVAMRVQSLVQTILGKDLPIGITEWNYDPGNPPPTYGDDPKFITQFSTNALNSMAEAGVAFACEFDAASYSGYGRLDMFDVNTNQPKPQYFAIKSLIAQYRTGSAVSVPTPTAVSIVGSQGTYGPLISRDKPVTCFHNDTGAGGTGAIVDGHYGNWGFWRPSLSALPSWCAIHVGTGPTRLLLTWESDYVTDYTSEIGLSPQDYTISVSSDSTDGADGTWQTVVSVVGNHTRVREHLLPFAGRSWVKMTMTKEQPQATQPYIFIDEIDLYDVSTSLNDTFFFSGDSTTPEAYNRSNEHQPSFAEDVHAAFPQRFPAMLDGGLEGWTSDRAVQDIDLWLSLNPDIHYWLLQWGTNDAFAGVAPEHFRTNLQTLIDKIKKAGHVPILARLPYTNKPGNSIVDQEIQSLNAVIDQVAKTNQLIPGPDLYQLFRTHTSTYLNSDGINPTSAGAIAMNLAWFHALRPYLYQH